MFLLSQNDENQSENGSKNSKIRLRARPPAEPQKKMLQTKKLRSKSWKTRFFFTFRLPILDGRVHEQVSSVLFFTVFFEGERHDLSKTGGFGRKMPPPPPGKPVTFYECHPEDHAPAPSVRADFMENPNKKWVRTGGVPTKLAPLATMGNRLWSKMATALQPAHPKHPKFAPRHSRKPRYHPTSQRQSNETSRYDRKWSPSLTRAFNHNVLA